MNRQRVVLALLAAAAIGIAAVAGAAGDNRGAAELILDGGSRGQVQFPHHRHQAALDNDCKICHSLFPQDKGTIQRMKADGTLAKKKVMNGLCLDCHKDRKKAGEKGGPVTCKQCHTQK